MPISQNQTDDLYAANVLTQDGDNLGKVTQVYLDESTSAPTWVTVDTGLFGTKESFVPIGTAELTDGQIKVPYQKSQIKDSPRFDTDQPLSDRDQDELLAHYSLQGGAEQNSGTGQTSGAGRNSSAGNTDTSHRHGPENPNAESTPNADQLTLHEEKVDVGTQSVETGRVRLRKHVVTEHESVTVPVQHEEVEVVREPVNGADSTSGTLEDDEISVTTHEDRPVVNKSVEATERVGVDRKVVPGEEEVLTDTAHEEVDVVREGQQEKSHR